MRQKILFVTKLISILSLILVLVAIIFSINDKGNDIINSTIKIIFPLLIVNLFVRVLITPKNKKNVDSPLFIERRIGYGWGINIDNPIGRNIVLGILILLFIVYLFTLI